MTKTLRLVGEYHMYDPSPEAVKWRKQNKKRVRPLVKRRQNSGFWLLWLAVGLTAFASPLLALVLACVVAYVVRSDRG